jgi:hypothetical protein
MDRSVLNAKPALNLPNEFAWILRFQSEGPPRNFR